VATAAAAAATGKLYCKDHQGLADADNGCIAQRGKSSRWICYPCQRQRATALKKRTDLK
jgi:hypothetical protein